ncbi:MAG: glycosyltransferase family 39 protein [Myxococcales bacterium]|nr:glycosyltransferase family 39 protein [Polyangiaceae bacterium]MDW8248235.1 glycosyltransferase family 39 protein [Myxococcales bacterium]
MSEAAQETSRPRDQAEDPGDEVEELIPPGNPPRWRRGGLLLTLGALLALGVMGYDRPLRWGVLLGGIGVLLAATGALDLVGTFDDAQDRVVRTVSFRDLAKPLLALLGSISASFVVLLLATSGRLSLGWSAALLPAGSILTLMSLYWSGTVLGPWATDETGQYRPLGKRHGFWVVAAACTLYLPAAGAHSLTDPWETHYGEVAREILARNDWISTWWAQDGWFFSKPVLNFWLQAMAMAMLGVQYEPGAMLEPKGGVIPRPEWAVRMPVVVLAVVALYLLYKGVARVFGRRAGLLGALVLMAMPQWAFLAHQTMTDMPFVATMASAMGLLLLGIHTDSEKEAPRYEVRAGAIRVRVSAFHLIFGMILLSALPQIFYLISRNLEVSLGGEAMGFRWHGDVFWSGSPGNCGLPGNEPCAQQLPFHRWLQPGLQGLFWAVALGALLYLNAGERRQQRLCYLGAFFFASLATLGKGPAGLLLPVLCALLYVAVTGRWRELTQFEILSGLLLLLAVALPWYLAMYLRHGPPFVDRLIFHDMWKRALTHVHDTNEGDDVSFRFYIWQLGYAVFPWTGLVPTALVAWARRPDDADDGRGDASVLLALWFVVAFTLFAWMLTKFHHYIFPAVPPAAMLAGVLLDRMMGDISPDQPLRPSLIAGIAGGLLGFGGFLLLPGSLDGFRGEDGSLSPPMPALGAMLVLAALSTLVWISVGQRSPLPLRTSEDGQGGLIAAAVLAGAPLLALVGRDLTVRPPSEVVGEARLMHLFTYNYRRAWPDSLDFSGVLGGVAAAAVLLSILLAVRRLRASAAVALVGLSLVFGAWCLDVYFIRTAPHWGQRETIAAYYRHREGPQQPLIAYQMNWKGENFYTGNRVPAFVASGERFKAWVKEQRAKGVGTMFFTTEHGRVGSLKSELGNPGSVEVLTDRKLNNKFALIRVRFEEGEP